MNSEYCNLIITAFKAIILWLLEVQHMLTKNSKRQHFEKLLNYRREREKIISKKLVHGDEILDQ